MGSILDLTSDDDENVLHTFDYTPLVSPDQRTAHQSSHSRIETTLLSWNPADSREMKNYKGRCTVDRALPATPPRKGKKGRVVSSGRETVGKDKLPLPSAKRLRNASRHLNRSSVRKDLEFDCDKVVATSTGLVTQFEDPAVKLAAKYAKVVASHARHKNPQVFATFGKPEFDKKLFEFPFYTHKGMIAWLDRYSLRRHRMRLIEYPHCFAWIFHSPRSTPCVIRSTNRFSALSGSHGEWTEGDDLAAVMPPGLLPRNAPPPPGEVCPVCFCAMDDPAREDHRVPFRYRQCNHFNCFRCAALYWHNSREQARRNPLLGIDNARDTQIKCNICRTWTNIRPNFFAAELAALNMQQNAINAALAAQRLNNLPQPAPPAPPVPPPPPAPIPFLPVPYSLNPIVYFAQIVRDIVYDNYTFQCVGFIFVFLTIYFFLRLGSVIMCVTGDVECVRRGLFGAIAQSVTYTFMGFLGVILLMYFTTHFDYYLDLFMRGLRMAARPIYRSCVNAFQWLSAWAQAPPPPVIVPPGNPPLPQAVGNIVPVRLYTPFSYTSYVTVFLKNEFLFCFFSAACYFSCVVHMWRTINFSSFKIDRTPEADNTKLYEFYSFFWMTILAYSLVGYKYPVFRRYVPLICPIFIVFFILPVSNGYNPFHLSVVYDGLVLYGAHAGPEVRTGDDLGALFGLIFFGLICLIDKHLIVVFRTVLNCIMLIFNGRRVFVGVHARNMNLEYGFPLMFSDIQMLGNYTGYRTLNIYLDVHHAVFLNRAGSRWHPDLRRYIFGDTIQQLGGPGAPYDVDIAYNTALSIIQRVQMTRALEGHNIDHHVDVPIGDVHW